MAELNLAALPPGCELKPRKTIDRHGIGIDPRHVAEGDLRAAARAQQPAHALAEPRQVRAGDRATDGKGDRARLGGSHLRGRPADWREVIARLDSCALLLPALPV